MSNLTRIISIILWSCRKSANTNWEFIFPNWARTERDVWCLNATEREIFQHFIGAKWRFGVIVVIEIVDRWHCRIFITYIWNYCSRWEDHKYQGLDWIIRTCADPEAVLVTTHIPHMITSPELGVRLQTQILDPREIFSFSSLDHVTTEAVTSVS